MSNGKKNKYHAQPTWVDGIRFDSKREANRYGELLLLQRANEIAILGLQPRYRLVVNGQLICTYVGDFLYRDLRANQTVLEDTKGYRTPEYRLKKKLLRALYGIDIREV